MDFVYQLNPAVQTSLTYKGKTKYGFVGSGSDMEGFLFADGVNEHGLGAIQYF